MSVSASRAVVGDNRALAHLVQNAVVTGLSIKTVVLGGSVAAGHKCRGAENVPDFECAWPTSMAKALGQFGIQMEIHNLVAGGTGISVATRQVIHKEWRFRGEATKYGATVRSKRKMIGLITLQKRHGIRT